VSNVTPQEFCALPLDIYHIRETDIYFLSFFEVASVAAKRRHDCHRDGGATAPAITS
jgi:hypothetical protein